MFSPTGHDDDSLHYAERMVRVMQKIENKDKMRYYVIATTNIEKLAELLADALADQNGGPQ